MILALAITFLKTVNAKEEKEKTKPGGISNQTFRRIFRNFNFFETHIHPGALTFQKNENYKNFLETFDLRHHQPEKMVKISDFNDFLKERKIKGISRNEKN